MDNRNKKSEKKSDANGNKEKVPRSYNDIVDDIPGPDAKATAPDYYASLLAELIEFKELTLPQIQNFFERVKESIKEAWTPFLTKASLAVRPNKSANDNLIANEIVNCCKKFLRTCSLNDTDLEEAFTAFRNTKSSAIITEYLESTEKQAACPNDAQPKITSQDLACVAYTYLILKCKDYSNTNYDLLIKAERAIAEYFGKISLKDHAGRTVGNVLSMKSYSPKRIADYTYLFAGMSETVLQKDNRIAELKEQMAYIETQNTELKEDVTSWKNLHTDAQHRIEDLKSENEQLRKDRNAAEAKLEYETNRYNRQMQTKEEGIAEQLAYDIGLEIQAIKDTLEYVDEDNQRRIRRRLQRIDDILNNFGGNTNA